jgi:hypothetical protein
MDLCVMCIRYGTGLCPRCEVWAKKEDREPVEECDDYIGGE